MPETDPSWSKLARSIAAEVVAKLRTDPPLTTPWLNPEAAAAYVSLDVRGLETLRRHGRGPKYSRCSHRIVRYHVNDLDAWLRDNVERRGVEK